MGLSSYLKNKAKETVANIQAERAHNKAERLERREQYEQGRRKAEYERGLNSGYGRVQEVTEYNAKGKPVRTQRYAAPTQTGPSRSGGGARYTPDWKGAANIFGGGGSIGNADAWGFGETRQRQPPPMRTTQVNPVTGKITIREPYEKRNPTIMHDPSDFILGGGGMAGAAGGNGKKQRDPSDFILG